LKLLNNLKNIIRPLEIAWDDFWRKRSLRRRARQNLKLDTYLGYGRQDYLYAKGRVLEDRGILSEISDSRIRNFINSYKRFGTNEISYAQLRAKYHSHKFQLKADDEGYFKIDQQFSEPVEPRNKAWQKIKYKLLDVPVEGYLPKKYKAVKGRSEALIPPPEARFGVISDIDDTILQTHVTSFFKLRMVYATFFKNAYTRLPFEGAAEFYQALQKGSGGNGFNPIFYVSNSPWNIYDLLKNFMEVNDIPKGPIMLRDFGIPRTPRPDGYRGHKHEEVVKIVKTYPRLPFILIGDSGERDADIYLSVAQEFPGRIRAIYIRDVKDRKRARRIKTIIEDTTDVDIFLVRNSREAAMHALENDWITKQAFEQIP